MAIDKLVDSAQLDSDLNDIADAILAKSGGSSQIAFPAGFLNEIQSIPSGGGVDVEALSVSDNGTYTAPSGMAYSPVTVNVPSGGEYVADDWFDPQKPVGDIVCDAEITGQNRANYAYLLHGRKAIAKVSFPNAKRIPDQTLSYSSATAIDAPVAEEFESNAFAGTNLEYAVFPRVVVTYSNAFSNCTRLIAVDFGGTPTSAQGFIRVGVFSGCTALTTLVLRSNALWMLSNISVFDRTPFAANGTGGILYVPNDQIAAYQAATNWSVILGYANNQILPIEGSYYETHYADGTLIPTA